MHDESYFTLHDMKGSRLLGSVFNILFNLNKLWPLKPGIRSLFAREYIRLSMEEDVEDATNGSAEVWDESLEAPF
ncbi:hypothetical protein Droror1_Dr00027773 [Drosera rotundifolia]